MEEVYIVSAKRTPVGSFKGSLSSLSVVDLAVHAVNAALEFNSDVVKGSIDHLVFGNVLNADVGQNPSRIVALRSGLPSTTVCTNVNKVCASGMTAVEYCAMKIQMRQAHVCLAVGAESMSNVPFYLPRKEPTFGGVNLTDGIKRDGLNDGVDGTHMGEFANNTAKEYGITREAQDAYAIGTYRRAQAAVKSGVFAKEISPISIAPRRGPSITISTDEDVHKLQEEKVPSLRPAFGGAEGTITAANASSLNDGACALLLVSRLFAETHRLSPLCRVIDYDAAELPPKDFTISPAVAVKKMLARRQLSTSAIGRWEFNEAFSVTALAAIRDLGLEEGTVNVHGGAVAMGHPLGMSGARIVCHLAHMLAADPSLKLGCAAICNGGGGASCMLLGSVGSEVNVKAKQ